jgi:hypothetical protein
MKFYFVSFFHPLAAFFCHASIRFDRRNAVPVSTMDYPDRLYREWQFTRSLLWLSVRKNNYSDAARLTLPNVISDPYTRLSLQPESTIPKSDTHSPVSILAATFWYNWSTEEQTPRSRGLRKCHIRSGGNRKLITVFTRVRHWTYPRAIQIQSTSLHTTSQRSIIRSSSCYDNISQAASTFQVLRLKFCRPTHFSSSRTCYSSSPFHLTDNITSTDYEAPHYVIIFLNQLLPPS